MARFVTLYSGSSGNCCIIEQDGRFLLVDMGGSCKATLGALVSVGLTPKNLDGILVTHEHSDHIKGLAVFLKRVKVPVLGTSGTLYALDQISAIPHDIELMAMDTGSEVRLGDFMIRGFATSHDAACSCGWFITTGGGASAAVATDLGHMTPEVLAHLECADMVALEANYDPDMLRYGRYPAYLKNRISGQRGHLSNQDAATTVARLVAAGCRRVALCHLSEENNKPELAAAAVEAAMLEHGLRMPEGCVVQVARRYDPGDWMDF